LIQLLLKKQCYILYTLIFHWLDMAIPSHIVKKKSKKKSNITRLKQTGGVGPRWVWINIETKLTYIQEIRVTR
jgi:hypothetical protein